MNAAYPDRITCPGIIFGDIRKLAGMASWGLLTGYTMCDKVCLCRDIQTNVFMISMGGVNVMGGATVDAWKM